MTEEKQLSRDRFLILAVAFFYIFNQNLCTPLIVGFSKSIGASATITVMAGSILNLVSLLCRPFVGELSDTVEKHKVAALGLFLMTVASAGYMLTKSGVVLILLRVIGGVGFATCSVCMSTWLAELLPKNKLGSGMGMYGLMLALSMAVGPTLGVIFYTNFGYSFAFLLSTVFSAIGLCCIPFIKTKSPVAERSRQKRSLINKDVIPVAIILMIFTIPQMATQAYLISYVEAKGLIVSTSLYFPAYAAFLVLLRFVLKRYLDTVDFKVFYFTGLVSELVALVALWFMNSDILLVIAALGSAAGYGIMSTVCQATAIKLAGAHNAAVSNSTYYVGLDVGMILGPLLGGLLFENISLSLFYPVFIAILPLSYIAYRAQYKRRDCTQ